MAMTTKVCPECGSAKVSLPRSVLDSSNRRAECLSCDWQGTEGDLISAVLPDESSPDQAFSVAQEVAINYMRLLAQHAGNPVGRAMVESGLVGVKDTKNLTRLIRVACSAAYAATLEEINLIQKEMQVGGSN